MKYANLKTFFRNNKEARIFSKFRKGKKFSILDYFYIIKKIFLVELIDSLIFNFPTSVGFFLRQNYLKLKLKKCGKNVIFGKNIEIYNASDISIRNFSWIDNYVVLDCRFGYINIGSYVHVAPNCKISGGGGVDIADYVGISENVKIFSHSEIIQKGKKMSGPMVEESQKGYKSEKVVIEKDVFIGSGSIILPGVRIGEGAVVGANSVVRYDLKPWTIHIGNPIKLVGIRPK